VILKDAKVLSEIVGRLKEKKLGYAALLLPNLTAAAPQASQKILPSEALAWATDKVRAPKPLEALVTRLLGDVVIFRNSNRRSSTKKIEPALAMATVAGEYVSREGIVFH
jgi:Chromosome segregation ATPases